MISTAFEHFCLALCEAAGLVPPRLSCDQRGVTAFNFSLHDTTVSVMHASVTAPATVFIVVEFGQVPAAHALEAWQVLLDANLLMLEDRAPVFARNPVNGQVLLRLALPLEGIVAAYVYQRIVQIVDVARIWRENPLAPCRMITTSPETLAVIGRFA